jgi:hypothetical protein
LFTLVKDSRTGAQVPRVVDSDRPEHLGYAHDAQVKVIRARQQLNMAAYGVAEPGVHIRMPRRMLPFLLGFVLEPLAEPKHVACDRTLPPDTNRGRAAMRQQRAGAARTTRDLAPAQIRTQTPVAALTSEAEASSTAQRRSQAALPSMRCAPSSTTEASGLRERRADAARRVLPAPPAPRHLLKTPSPRRAPASTRAPPQQAGPQQQRAAHLASLS